MAGDGVKLYHVPTCIPVMDFIKNSVQYSVLVYSGTRLLTSTGVHLIRGQLLVSLMIVKVAVEVAPYR